MTSLVARLRLTNGANPLADRDWIAKVACTADNPTGQTDIDMPQTLRRLFGHTDFGVFAEVVTGGTITTGDKVTL
ncbi:hypothetical protein [Paracoccus sp. (in: a-proteobacteria)]|uniref:hypothetical protein n=1 Tax=Paracoccus sp. TaxID=267 RepID=UPI0026E0D377|nr:hypothetical protein [Paracoccus sp. (in: a-proteobacteria)]MDO5648102.1 hypothetical protein [Paracoccus sp. (in: a-proteobacteria)]